MKAVHKNSEQEFDLSKIAYTKLFGMYGNLVMLITKEIYFIALGEENNDTCYNVTDDFKIID